jgi:hypothetical protein
MEPKILYSGSSAEFLRKMAAFADTIPDLTRRLTGLKLSPAYSGLRSVKFIEAAPNNDKFVYDRSKDELTLYPRNFGPGDRIDHYFFKAIARRHWSLNIPAADKVRWSGMQVFVKRALVDRIAEALDGKTPFKTVINKFNKAVDKLVVIHVLNALTQNSVTPSQLKSMDFRKHTSVSDFLNGKRPFSIKPLVSAYGGDVRRVGDYEEAFSEYCLGRGEFKITESSTKEEFKNLFLEVSGVIRR